MRVDSVAAGAGTLRGMSIDYFAVRTADRARIGDLVEGRAQPDIEPIDVDAVRAAILAGSSLGGEPGTSLRWTGVSSHVSVFVSPTSVQVNQGGAFEERVLDVMIDLISTLTRLGLNVWDPQQGSWYPGSPVLRQSEGRAKPAPAKKSGAAKKATAKKASAKKKPAPKAKAKTKATAKSKARAKPKKRSGRA